MQKGEYSCGVYVIPAIATFAYSVGNIKIFGYYKYSNVLKDDIRKSAVTEYFNIVKEVNKTKGRRKQYINVMIHISNERIRYCRIGNTDSLHFSNEESIKTHGKRVYNKDQYIENLKPKM